MTTPANAGTQDASLKAKISQTTNSPAGASVGDFSELAADADTEAMAEIIAKPATDLATEQRCEKQLVHLTKDCSSPSVDCFPAEIAAKFPLPVTPTVEILMIDFLAMETAAMKTTTPEESLSEHRILEFALDAESENTIASEPEPAAATHQAPGEPKAVSPPDESSNGAPPTKEAPSKPPNECLNDSSRAEINLLQLELVKRRDLFEKERKIIGVFTTCVRTDSPETAAQAASKLDHLCPSKEDEIQDWLWMLWEIMLDIVRSPDATSEIHERIIGLLANLQQLAKREVKIEGETQRLWKDLPMLPYCMEAYFNDPTTGYVEFTPEAARVWYNINVFGARCLGDSTGGPYAEAVYALESALEEKPSNTLEIAECRIQVACAWVNHASAPLLRWALENVGCEEVLHDGDSAYLDRGALYDGPSTMCLQRWGFWIERFEKLGQEKDLIGENTRSAALEAAATMRNVEKRIGNTLSA